MQEKCTKSEGWRIPEQNLDEPGAAWRAPSSSSKYFCSRVRDSNKRSPHPEMPTDVEEILNQCG